ncbi:MAG TPA: SRPBCC domain-containing protein [Mycobacteriales bacterium]|nr:SRPBCC domain-containing protein [Mycobacteriales bacterium]
MRLRHEFTVPVPAGVAWPVLSDLERVVPLLPGVTLTSVTGRGVEGKLRVRVGSVTVTYHGSAGITELDERDRHAVISVRGQEARGEGSVRATVTARLHESDGGSRVTVDTTLSITGRLGPAGRDVLHDVGARLLARFAGQLPDLLATDSGSDPAPAPDADTDVAPDAGGTDRIPTRRPAVAAGEPAPVVHTDADPAGGRGPDPLVVPARSERMGTPMASFVDRSVDLPEAGGVPALRRVAPFLALVLLVLLIRHRRHHHR